MSETTKIEWCDSTFNPWIGCTKISPACDHCYAEALMDARHQRVKWGGSRVRTSTWHEPKRWQRQAAAFFAEHSRRRRVFCASLADVFDNQVSTDWRDDLWALIRDTPDIDWLLLTKRPQNIGKMLPAYWDQVKGHVWLGTTVEDQQRASQNIPHLLDHDAAVRFISVEPMLGPIDWKRWLPTAREAFRPGGERFLAPDYFMTRCEHCGWTGSSEMVHLDRGWDDADCVCPSCGDIFLCDEIPALDWVIAGGESGPNARPSHPDWLRTLRDQCAAADVPFLFKQWGAWLPGYFSFDLDDRLHFEDLDSRSFPVGRTTDTHHFDADAAGRGDPEGLGAMRVRKATAGRLLDGVEHNGFPEAV